jgi:hypothetical protein
MDETSSALPNEWIGKLFQRFRSIYGNRVQTMFGEADPEDLTQTWAQELGRYQASDIRSALDSIRTLHPDYPPSLFQFSGLCRDAQRRRIVDTKALIGPKIPMPEHVKRQLAEFMAKHTVRRAD